jgi:hypothetical protein
MAGWLQEKNPDGRKKCRPPLIGQHLKNLKRGILCSLAFSPEATNSCGGTITNKRQSNIEATTKQIDMVVFSRGMCY